MRVLHPLFVAFSVIVQAQAVRVQQPLQYSNNSTSTMILTPEIDQFIEGILSSWNSSGGVSVAVVKQDNKDSTWHVETKGYGVAQVKEGKKMDENSLVCIASNSKLFTTLAAGLLISDKSLSPRISWNAKIADILPEDIWKLADPIASSETTIIDAMSHRTGLPRHDLMYTRTDTSESILRRLRHLKPSAPFRSTWQYNNNMYTLLSYLPTYFLPEHPPFARYVKEKILDPLGLTSTTYSPQVARESGHLADPIAREGVDKDKDIFGKGKTRVMRFPGWFLDEDEDGSFKSGAGGVIMNAKDAATWLQVLLLNGEHPQTHKQVIPIEVLKKVTSGITVQTAEPRYPELSTTVYGGGQARGSYRGHNYIEHGGATIGYRTQITRFPDSKFGVALFSNDDDWGSSFIEVIKWRIIDKVFGLEPIGWDSRTKKAVIEAHEKRQSEIKPRPENPTLPSVLFKQLLGVYRNLGYGDIEFCSVGGDDDNTQTCKEVLEDLPTVLPGGVRKDIPTLIAKWDRFWSTHVKLEHFDGVVFNLTILDSRPTDDPSDPYWTATFWADDIHKAEFVIDEGRVVGFGITSKFWGAGSEVEDPVGGSVKEKAEVWFDKV